MDHAKHGEMKKKMGKVMAKPKKSGKAPKVGKMAQMRSGTDKIAKRY